MIWIILIVIVVFLIGSALPLLKQIGYEKKQRKASMPESSDEHIEEHHHEGGNWTP